MVFFTCAHCGESLKKNKVEKHYQTICSRRPVSLTCIDCCKDFSDETYPAHTKCVSEEEKYSAKGFVPRPSANKGELKQQKWQDIIHSMHKNQSSLSRDEQMILNAIAKHENAPRKKSKFQNYLRSIMNNKFNIQAADTLFDKVEALSKEEEAKNKQDNKQEAENTGATDDNTEIKGNDNSPSQDTQVGEKLSKKERKERRKKAKYEQELKEIEGYQGSQAELGDENEDEDKKKKTDKQESTAVSMESENIEHKRSRKKHKADVNGAQNGIKEDTEIKEEGRSKKKHKKGETVITNGISGDSESAKGGKSKKQIKGMGVTETGDSEVPESRIPKKKRKKGQDGAEGTCREEEEPTKKLKRNDTEVEGEEEAPHTAAQKTKFNWQQIIIQVLESKGDKEMPIKRLQKKVLAEFQVTGGGSATDVKTIAKFNKKLHKTLGVVVRKEVAKLTH